MEISGEEKQNKMNQWEANDLSYWPRILNENYTSKK